jgi:hypothetical protein
MGAILEMFAQDWFPRHKGKHFDLPARHVVPRPLQHCDRRWTPGEIGIWTSITRRADEEVRSDETVSSQCEYRTDRGK